MLLSKREDHALGAGARLRLVECVGGRLLRASRQLSRLLLAAARALIELRVGRARRLQRIGSRGAMLAQLGGLSARRADRAPLGAQVVARNRELRLRCGQLLECFLALALALPEGSLPIGALGARLRTESPTACSGFSEERGAASLSIASCAFGAPRPFFTMLGFSTAPSSTTLCSLSAAYCAMSTCGHRCRSADLWVSGKGQGNAAWRKPEVRGSRQGSARTFSVTAAHTEMSWLPLGTISGSTIGTRPCRWQMAA